MFIHLIVNLLCLKSSARPFLLQTSYFKEIKIVYMYQVKSRFILYINYSIFTFILNYF